MLESLTPIALLAAFGIELTAEAAIKFIAAKWRTAGVTNHDLQKALRESYCDALSSIEFGFQRREGLLDALGKRRLYREITTNFDKEFLTPFISETSLSQDELESRVQEGAKYCRILREAVDQLLPKEDVPNITIEDLLLTGRKLKGADDLRKLNSEAKADLMTKVRSVEGVPKFFFDFLDYKDLLMGSIVFFYGERIKADERVRSILTHAELQRIREEQSQQYQKQAAKLETALQSQMSAFQQFLSPIKDNFAEVLTCLDRLEAEWAETTRYLQRILDLIALDKGLSHKDKRQLEAGLSPSFDLRAKYEFDERKPIGYGAVATVYRALHKGIRRVRAIKVLKPEHRENQEVVERFLREAVVLGSLKHPNIVQIYDAGGGGPNLDFYLEMEYVEGVTLRNFIKTHEFDLHRTLKFIKQLGSAIQSMHENGIIHRDLNPRNIMVDKNGDLKVMDFGVAKIIGVEGLTRDGQVVGTTDYMAPEQARGERVDERADIFSFGVIIYELCTRRLPSTPPLSLRQYEPSTPEWLEDTAERCLKQARQLRYASMKEVLTAIEKQEQEAIRKAEVKEAPVLSLDCQYLDFADIASGSPATRSFTIRNAGTGRLTGKITTSHPWLEISPPTIDLEMGEQTVHVTADTTYLSSGVSADGEIQIATNGGEAKVSVGLSTTTEIKPAKTRVTRRLVRKTWFPYLVIGLALIVALLAAALCESKAPSSLTAPSQDAPSSSVVNVQTSSAIGKIAFDSLGYICVINADGSGFKRLTERRPDYGSGNVRPAWSPDGTKIAFVCESDGMDVWEIYLINADGSNEKRVTGVTAGRSTDLKWSPNGKRIAFCSDRGSDREIYVMNADGSNQRNLTNNPQAYDDSPTWSSDGEKIAFASNRDSNLQIYVMNADGSNQRSLTNKPHNNWNPAWSPDGKRIAFCSGRDFNVEIYAMNADGSNQRNLTNNPQAYDDSPTWSPDGTKIAFDSKRDDIVGMYVMNADGSNQRNVVNDPYFWDQLPRWSPDSKWIAYTGKCDGNNLCISIVNVDGSERRNLTGDNVEYSGLHPVWAPK